MGRKPLYDENTLLDAAVELVRAHGLLYLHPLCGGLAPDVAWPYLRRAADAVAAAHA